MALRTAQVDLSNINNELKKIARKTQEGVFLEALKSAAAFLLSKMKEKCPVDTGALKSSGRWEQTGPAEITIGFNKEYASIQNYGGVKLPNKGYGSVIGPNEYFTGTLDEYEQRVREIISEEIARIMANG